MAQPLDRCRVLVVEDESLIAMDLDGFLRRAGCEVVGPVGRVEAATRWIADRPPDLALLDVNLGGGETVFPLADALAALRVPFVFLTGYEPEALPERFRQRPIASKPYSAKRLLAMLAEAVGSGGRAMGPSGEGAAA
ncbi:MAG TPA: response regulator [Geminicoccaceae bacterium]